jgi:hypothetical protein
VLLGANGLALAMATALREAGAEPVVIESNPDRANQAREEGFRVIFGNGLSERVALRARPEQRLGALALTPNEEANLLFARRMVDEYDCPHSWVALDRVAGHLSQDVLHEAEVGILFRHSRDLSVWSLWLERGRARVTRWQKAAAGEDPAPAPDAVEAGLPSQQPAREPLLPLVVWRNSRVAPVDEGTVFREGDLAWFAIDSSRGDAAAVLLQTRGWVAVDGETGAADGKGIRVGLL